MSYDVFLFRFEHGQPVRVDGARLRELIEPLIVRGDEQHDQVTLRAADGGDARVYGVSDDPECVMFTHWSWGDICDLMADLARELGMAVVPPDRPTMITDERQRSDLPEDLRAEAVVVRAGIDVQRVINPTSLGEPAGR